MYGVVHIPDKLSSAGELSESDPCDVRIAMSVNGSTSQTITYFLVESQLLIS